MVALSHIIIFVLTYFSIVMQYHEADCNVHSGVTPSNKIHNSQFISDKYFTCSTSFTAAIVITVMAFDDNDDDHGQRRPWLRSPRWSWSSSVMLNGVDLMGALCDKFQAGALGHSQLTLLTSSSSTPLTCTLPPSHLTSALVDRQAQRMGLCVCWQIPTICKTLMNTFWGKAKSSPQRPSNVYLQFN